MASTSHTFLYSHVQSRYSMIMPSSKKQNSKVNKTVGTIASDNIISER